MNLRPIHVSELLVSELHIELPEEQPPDHHDRLLPLRSLVPNAEG